MADENLKIDLDAPGGVRMSKDPISQMEVYMYYSNPGVYLTPLGGVVPEEIASRAGYDVEAFGKQRLRADKLKAFQSQLDAELWDDGAAGNILEERGGYKLVEVGSLGHVKVIDDEGHSMVAVPLPKELGQDLFDRLAGPATQAVPKGKAQPKSMED